MPQQTKARNVVIAFTPSMLAKDAPAMFIRHSLPSPVPDVLVSAVIFSQPCKNADPQRFRQEQFTSGLCGMFFFTRSVGTIPVTARPKIGPAHRWSDRQPAQYPPDGMHRSTFGYFAGNFRGKFVNRPAGIAIAIIGLPPIAKISLMALSPQCGQNQKDYQRSA